MCNTPKGVDGPPTDYDIYQNNYLDVPLSTSYKTSATAPLDVNSPLVSTINCIKSGGTTVFAAALDKARQTLAANHDPEAQDVIIFFTDGEANYGACVDSNNDSVCENNNTPSRATPCRAAITSADQAAAAGVWVFGIAYATPSAGCLGWKSSGTGCNKTKGYQFSCAEVPAITANTAVQQIASDDSKFYSSPNPGDLTVLFKRIAVELTEGRLIDDDATQAARRRGQPIATGLLTSSRARLNSNLAPTESWPSSWRSSLGTSVSSSNINASWTVSPLSGSRGGALP